MNPHLTLTLSPPSAFAKAAARQVGWEGRGNNSKLAARRVSGFNAGMAVADNQPEKTA
jgi:hypothetical protein